VKTWIDVFALCMMGKICNPWACLYMCHLALMRVWYCTKGKQHQAFHPYSVEDLQQFLDHLLTSNSLLFHNLGIAFFCLASLQPLLYLEQLCCFALRFDAFVQSCNAFHKDFDFLVLLPHLGHMKNTS
jgi:hypothetical protein